MVISVSNPGFGYGNDHVRRLPTEIDMITTASGGRREAEATYRRGGTHGGGRARIPKAAAGRLGRDGRKRTPASWRFARVLMWELVN